MSGPDNRLGDLGRETEADGPELRPRPSDLRRIRIRRRLVGGGVSALVVLLLATGVMAGSQIMGGGDDDPLPPSGQPTTTSTTPAKEPATGVRLTPALDDAIEKLGPTAMKRWPDTFADLWVEEVNESRDEDNQEHYIRAVFIAFTEDAEQNVENLRDSFPEPDLLQAVTFDRSIRELRSRLRTMGAERERVKDGSLVVPWIPDRYDMGIDVKRNAIYVVVEDLRPETVAAFKSRYGDDVIVEEGGLGVPD